MFGFRLLAVFVILLLTTGIATAQTVSDLDQIESDAVLARLSDSQIRELVSDRIGRGQDQQAESELPFNPAIPIWRLQKKVALAKSRLTELLSVRGRLKSEFASGWARVTGEREGGSFGRLLLTFLVAFVGAFLVERVVSRHFLRYQPAPPSNTPEGVPTVTSTHLGLKLSKLATLFATMLARIVVFTMLSFLIMLLVVGNSNQDQTTFLFYLGAIVIVRVTYAFATVFYAPRYPELRLPLYTTSDATGLHRGLVITFCLTSFAFFTCALLGTMGVTTDAHPLLLLTVGNIYVIAFCLTVFLYRRAITNDLTHGIDDGETLGQTRQWFGGAWPWLIIVIVICIWLAVAFDSLTGGEPLYGAAFYTSWVMLFYPAIDATLEREAMRAIALREDISVAIARVVRLIGAVVVVLSLAVSWRVNLLTLDGSSVGAKVTAAALQIIFTLLVAYAVWQVARIWFDRKIAEEDAELLGDDPESTEIEIGGTGLSRARTLLPLLRMTLLVTLVSIVVMLVLSALGINIAPVLAGAGVVGLAIGFGSQTLVRDVVSGAFFLIDDAFRLGEYVDVGAVKGTVEKIQLRSLRLRHHRGAVHTIPFGEITHLTNYSRDWAIMKLKFRVPFETDIEKVRKVLKKVGQGLLEHPDIGEDFLQPFKSQGVLEVDDYGLVVRAKFMCKPGAQFLIRRHAYTAVQKAFSDNDIEFAQPEIRVVASSDDEDLKPPSPLVTGGAAMSLKTDPPPA